MTHTIDIESAITSYVTMELDGYYTGDDLYKRVRETLAIFRTLGKNPLHYQFIQETRVNEDTFQTESWLGWQLKGGGSENGSILIKD